MAVACFLAQYAGAAPVVDLATQVRAIFSAKCVECHGATLERPKGKFGYVLDLTRVAANPKMVVPGNPDKSRDLPRAPR